MVRRPNVDRMRKRAGLLPPRQTTVVSQRVFDDHPALQRVLNGLAVRVRRGMPGGCRLHAHARVVDPGAPPGRQEIEVTVYARRDVSRLFDRRDTKPVPPAL